MTTITDQKFDAVKYMREQRQQLSAKLSHMTKAEILAYFKQRSKESIIKPSA